MNRQLMQLLEENPIIAAVKDDAGLNACCENPEIHMIFLLYGDVCNIHNLLKKIHAKGKLGMVHIDLIQGLSGKEAAVRFLQGFADGIISTKPTLISEARRLGMFGILRVFLLDSMAIENLALENRICHPDAIEILPGLMPGVISRITKTMHVPIIAGGLISQKQEAVAALSAGAVSVSSSKREIWDLA